MTLRPGSLILCLILALIDHSQGIQFSLDKTADSYYCGHLYCWAHKSFTDTSIYSVVTLSIYDVTTSNSPVKLASMSVFDSSLYVDQTNVFYQSTTGHIAWNSADLTISLRRNTDCANGIFMCELDFVNIDERPEKITQTTSSGTVGNCLVVNQIAQGISQIDTRLGELEKENADLKQQLEKVLQQVSVTQNLTNNSTREKFMLWGTVPTLRDPITDGGVWVVIQRRTKGDVDFYRGWDDYKKGFGTPDTDFWIGLDNIHNLTLQGYTELRIDMELNGKQYYAHYSNVSVTDESSNYRLSVGGYSGTAGDSLTIFHNGMQFSTFDRDHDAKSNNCAADNHGAWWYNTCYTSNLNGLWGSQDYNGVVWGGIANVSLNFAEMKLRHA